MTALQKIEDPADVLLRALDEMLAGVERDTIDEVLTPEIRSNTNAYERARLLRRHRKWPVRRLIEVQQWTAHRMLRCASCERPIQAESEYLHFKAHTDNRHGRRGFDHCMRCSMMARAVWGEDADIAIVQHLIMKASAPGRIRVAWLTVLSVLESIVHAIPNKLAARKPRPLGLTSVTATMMTFLVLALTVAPSAKRTGDTPPPPP